MIGEYLRNMKQLERQILKEMQQSRLEATKYHVSYQVLYERRKTNHPLAMVLVGTEEKSNVM